MLPQFKKAEPEAAKPATPTLMDAAPPATVQRPTVSAPRAGDRLPPSVIGPDLVIRGNLTSRGQVQIDGEVEGDIRGTHIIVGEKARITGAIIGEEVVVRGNVMGSIRGKRVMLQAHSHVEGDIYHQALAIEQGAFFEGKSRRSDDPLAGGQVAEPPPMVSAG
ncbi:MAG: polymer-forming cytoskeletal protein [Hyphomicrobiaceae bacterium]|nr:polymer-forming cytoskeletal protein [Hyphomicrobiaceae bacterium]